MSIPSDLSCSSPSPKASFTCPPTPKASFTDVLPPPSSPGVNLDDLFSCPPTPKASFTDILPPPPTPSASFEGLFSRLSTPESVQGVSPNVLTGGPSADAPLESPPPDDCNNCGCNDLDDDRLDYHRDNNDAKVEAYHEEDDDDVLFVGCQPISNVSLDSPIGPEKPTELTKGSSAGDSLAQRDTSSAPTKTKAQAQEATALNRDTILQIFAPLLDLAIQRYNEGHNRDSILLELGIPNSSQTHQKTLQGHPRQRQPSTIQKRLSANPRKRKRISTSNRMENRASKRAKTYPCETEIVNYKVIDIDVTLSDVSWKRGQPEMWKYEPRKIGDEAFWINEAAPKEFRSWKAEELFTLLGDWTVQVRPNSGWHPVSMQWHGTDEDEAGTFQGSDILQDWSYQITSVVMFDMLRMGSTGEGEVIKCIRDRR
ncbi:hypothetical protein FLAG1_08178 [Fusarium langsethiae]|uniref:Uncharacterized protein n=1 Tax=Fusarium langsethiae TaxID=179993 RepID=A0A0M9ET66_FUSLA|nr:hypothetical protein FLAG1_08178 [Fusarium langsethiae]GKU05937.1 unnamed protein product [Fusarium langsethiae]